jgi:hypothetical protein
MGKSGNFVAGTHANNIPHYIRTYFLQDLTVVITVIIVPYTKYMIMFIHISVILCFICQHPNLDFCSCIPYVMEYQQRVLLDPQNLSQYWPDFMMSSYVKDVSMNITCDLHDASLSVLNSVVYCYHSCFILWT